MVLTYCHSRGPQVSEAAEPGLLLGGLRQTGTRRSAARHVACQLTACGVGGKPQHQRHGSQRLAVGQARLTVSRSFSTHVAKWSSLAGQHHNPSGREVLHVELEIKEGKTLLRSKKRI